ncbi:MAG TPA: helix-turn-helix transcriptional regulator [Solirubrobacterales bacterium]|nr:helix-turn-helix transcriptional regulator [Solirubrobacterales bacterium]
MPTEPAPALPKNFLRPCLLLLLREEKAHGYDLLERVQALGFDGSDPGGLYRALRALEKEKLVWSAWEPSVNGPDRRTYEITRAGMEELHRNAKAIASGQETVARFLSRYQEFVALPRRARAARPSRDDAASVR